MEVLDNYVWHFWQTLGELSKPIPEQVWHYTSAEGLMGILTSRTMWLTSSMAMEDTMEIHWGNDLVAATAEQVRAELGGHPALSVLLHDESATLFRKQTEMFLGCFTTAEDSGVHWQRGECKCGGALVFDATELSKLRPGTGLVRVQYDERLLCEVSCEYLRKAISLAEEALVPPVGDSAWRAVAQYLMEPGGLAFCWKQAKYGWEREWRIIRRAFVRPEEILESPRRRVELDIPRDRPPVVHVVLGPNVSAAVAANVQAAADRHWGVPVRRSMCRLEL